MELVKKYLRDAIIAVLVLVSAFAAHTANGLQNEADAEAEKTAESIAAHAQRCQDGDALDDRVIAGVTFTCDGGTPAVSGIHD